MTRSSAVRWRVLGLLVIASAVAYLLRINVSIAGSAMATDLGLSATQLGIVLGAFAWSYGIFQIPGGVFGEAVGARRALTGTMIGWGVVTAVTALVPGSALAPTLVSLGALVAIRFVLGAFQAPFYPLYSGSVVARWFPPTSWALPNGLGSTGLTLGAAAAGPLLAWLVGSLGWRLAFVVTAPFGFLFAGLWWWYYRDDPIDHRAVSAEELAVIRAGSVAPPTQERSGWKAVLVNRDILSITFSYFCMNYVFYLFFNWFFYYLTEVRKVPAQAGGNFTGAQWIVGAIAATLGGVLCDRLSARYGARVGCRTTVIGSLLISAPLLVAGALTASPGGAVLLLSLSFGFTQLTEGAFWTAAMRIAGHHASAATGVMNTGGNVVGGIGALLVPVTAATFGWVVAVSTGAIFAVLAAVPWLWIRADRPMAGSGDQTK